MDTICKKGQNAVIEGQFSYFRALSYPGAGDACLQVKVEGQNVSKQHNL